MPLEKLIRFQGNEYLLIGTLEEGGPITTKEQFENGECSYAHLDIDGTIKRYRVVIGTRDEITLIGECEVSFKDTALNEILTGKSWSEGVQIALINEDQMKKIQ